MHEKLSRRKQSKIVSEQFCWKFEQRRDRVLNSEKKNKTKTKQKKRVKPSIAGQFT